MEELEQTIADLEPILKELKFTKGQDKDHENNKELLKPLHLKDIQSLPEFVWARKDFLAWHESFTSMLNCKAMQ